MRFLMAAAILAMASPVAAQDWTRLNGGQMKERLSGSDVIYDNSATQNFEALGGTTYIAGRPSRGTWRVSIDQYCSQWPPSKTGDCYDVEISGATGIRFLDGKGNNYTGKFVN